MTDLLNLKTNELSNVERPNLWLNRHMRLFTKNYQSVKEYQ